MRRIHRLLPLPVLMAVSATAQNIDWVEFQQDNSLLVGPASTGLNDVQEKDFAWGDLDQDGYTDLVVVRKQPFTTAGRHTNVLFMNEGGTLTDRTSQYASASDVPGDTGFSTPTNDREVLVVDVNNDGWLDVLTVTTISPGQAKHVSHPRVYMNLGDTGGSWLGLMYEEARIPDFGTFPNFCGAAAGDVNGDGFVDLYFAHYEQSATVDLDDRLLINDGTGFFADESTTRMTAMMLASSFGVSASIADMNGDGVNDIVKDTALGSTGASGPRLTLSYNNPLNEGFFNFYTEPYNGAPYHSNVGDLNQDGRMDMILADDGADRYLLNEGNDTFGRVIWSAAYNYGNGADDGFGSNNLVTDLDNDGWPDVLIADVDVDIGGCNRRLHIYHNRGGTVGGFVALREESGQGFRGVKGLTISDMRGTHDIAPMDLDNDGDLDLVIGRCNGMDIWVNQLDPSGTLGTLYCQPAVANSTGGPGLISAAGSLNVADNNLTVSASSLPSNQFGYFLGSQTQALVMGPGGSAGNLCLGGTIGRFVTQVQSSGAAGEISIPVNLNAMPAPLPAQVQVGETWNFQAWYRDVNPTPVSNFTEAVSLTLQ